MNTLTGSCWLSNLEMGEYDLFGEENEKFLSHEMASVFDDEQSLTSESNSFIDEISFDYFERPTKVMKTIDFTENISPPQISPSSTPSTTTISPFHSQILSFGNDSQHNETETVLLQKGNKRSPANAQDHVMAERKRRERLTQSFIEIAALVPGLKKMDKASVLVDAIKYMKVLKKRLRILEEESKKTCDDSYTTCDDESIEKSLFKVEARVLKQELMIRIQCQKHKEYLHKMMFQIQSLNLFVVCTSILPFGDIFDITIIAQMGEGYSLSIKELVKKLRMAGMNSV